MMKQDSLLEQCIFPPHKGAFFSSNDQEKIEIKSLTELERYRDIFRN